MSPQRRTAARWTIACGVLAVLGMAGQVQAATLKREPPMGALKPGQVVQVDDGSCPTGEIKRVVGGDHVKVGGRYQIERQRSCVKR